MATTTKISKISILVSEENLRQEILELALENDIRPYTSEENKNVIIFEGIWKDITIFKQKIIDRNFLNCRIYNYVAQ